MSEERKGEKKVSRRGVVGAITAGIAGFALNPFCVGEFLYLYY